MCRPSSLTVLLLLTTMPPLVAAGGGPKLVQTVTWTENLRDLAVSPSGNQLAVVTASHVNIHLLDPDGKIKPAPNKTFPCDGAQRVAFTPDSKRILVATSEPALWYVARDTLAVMQRVSLAREGFSGGAMFPEDIYVLEDPSLVFVKGQWVPHIAVLNWRAPGKPIEWVDLIWSGFDYGTHVAASTDGSRVFWSARYATAPYNKIIYSRKRQGNDAAVWAVNLSSDPSGLCVGPGPDHLLLVEAGVRQLAMYRQSDGALTVGCPLDTVGPADVAFTNDGYYAVILDRWRGTLEVVSGHDLRARLDPAAHMAPEAVRKAIVTHGQSAETLALHPALAVAYAVTTDQKIARFRLAIPGITHP